METDAELKQNVQDLMKAIWGDKNKPDEPGIYEMVNETYNVIRVFKGGAVAIKWLFYIAGIILGILVSIKTLIKN